MNRVDRRLALLQKWALQYGPQVAQLFGKTETFAGGGIGKQVYQVGKFDDPNQLAGTDPRSHLTTYSRDFLKTASRRDLRGSLIHELARTYGAGFSHKNPDKGYSGHGADRSFALADYARYKLNPREASYWTPSERVLAIAERRGDTVTAPNGGPPVGNIRRNHNTLRDNASTQGAFAAPASSAQTVTSGGQLAAARYQYLTQLAALKAQRGIIGQTWGLAKADARSAAIGSMGAAEADAASRGVLGGSADLNARAAIIAERARAREAANAEHTAGILGLGQAALGARADYYMNTANIQNDLYQSALTNSITAFKDDMFGTVAPLPDRRDPRHPPRIKTGISTPYHGPASPLSGSSPAMPVRGPEGRPVTIHDPAGRPYYPHRP